MASLDLEILPDTLAVCRLAADAIVPAWASAAGSFSTVTRTSDELSVTVVQEGVPRNVQCLRDYRAIKIRGPLAPELVGILLSVAEPLGRAGLSIFAIATYDTDYVLIKARDLVAAITALRAAGHRVSGDTQ